VSDPYVTTFTTSPACGASAARPWPTNIATCPGESSVPADPGVGTRSPGVSRDSVVAVPSRICVDVVRLRGWPPEAHAATIRLEQSHAAGPFAPKMSGFPRWGMISADAAPRLSANWSARTLKIGPPHTSDNCARGSLSHSPCRIRDPIDPFKDPRCSFPFAAKFPNLHPCRISSHTGRWHPSGRVSVSQPRAGGGHGIEPTLPPRQRRHDLGLALPFPKAAPRSSITGR
jgi:hypothetical protein